MTDNDKQWRTLSISLNSAEIGRIDAVGAVEAASAPEWLKPARHAVLKRLLLHGLECKEADLGLGETKPMDGGDRSNG